MYGRYSNPYAELGDGIQQGLNTLADTQVKLAQIRNDRELRDRDYSQRLREFNSQEDWRNKQYAMQQAQETRSQYEHDQKNRTWASQQIAGVLAEAQRQDGTLDPSKEQYVMSQLKAFESDPYVAEMLGSQAALRTNGKYDRVSIEKGPSGFMFSMYNSKDPSKRGVITENASTDPNDRVSQFTGEHIVGFAQMAEQLKNLGAPPSSVNYFLNPVDLSIDEDKFSEVVSDATQKAQQPSDQVPTQQTQPVAEAPVKAQPEPKPAPADNLSAYRYQTVFDAANRAADVRKKESEAAKAAVDPLELIARDIQKGRDVRITPENVAQVRTNPEFSARYLKETEADRRMTKQLAEGAELNNRRLGRLLLVGVAKGDINPTTAAGLMESGRARAVDLAEAYIKSPSYAQAQFQLMARGGAKGKPENYEEDVSKGITDAIKTAQSTLNTKGFKMGIGELGTAARSAMLYAGVVNPDDQVQFLHKNQHQLISAIEKTQRQIGSGLHKDRDLHAVVAMNLMSELRDINPPATFDEEQKAAYQSGLMDVLNRFGNIPQYAPYAADLYRAKVAATGDAKVPIGEIERDMLKVMQAVAEKERLKAQQK